MHSNATATRPHGQPEPQPEPPPAPSVKPALATSQGLGRLYDELQVWRVQSHELLARAEVAVPSAQMIAAAAALDALTASVGDEVRHAAAVATFEDNPDGPANTMLAGAVLICTA
jgi:hypothetical protein